MSSPLRRSRRLLFAVLALVGAQVGVLTASAGADVPGPGPDDHVYVVGDAPFHGSTGDTPLSGNVTGMARTSSGAGYLLATTSGRVFAFGDASFLGDFASWPPYRPIVDIASVPGGNGYWLLDEGGNIYGFNAPYHGSVWWGLSSPAVAIRPTATGEGYWLVDAAGGIFPFGDARFVGSMGGVPLNQPIVAMAATPTGNGYWLVARDAGVFSFGDARFFGTPASAGGFDAAAFEPTPTGLGYWIVGTDGRVSSHGDAPPFPAVTPLRPVTAAASTPTGQGLWLASEGNGPPPPPPPGGIEGVVSDDTGAPAQGICVNAYSGPPTYRSYSASTSVTGYYRMENVGPGDYGLSFYDCDGQDHAWASYPGPVTVSPGAFTTANGTVERMAGLSGTITDASGTPISGACVNVVDAAHNHGGGGLTSITGHYRVGGLRASSYSIEFRGCDPEGENWAAEWWNDKDSEATSDRIDLRPGDHRDGIDAVLEPGAAITGVVTDEAGAPVHSMCVQAYTPGGENRGFAHSSITGYYRLAGLRPGDYKVDFTGCNSNGSSSPSFAAEWWDDKPTLGAADAVTTTAGTTAEHIDAVLAPGGTISGRVTDGSGKPLSGICMTAYDSDNIHVTYNWTNSDGTYELTGMGNTSYRVRASDCTLGAYATEWYNDKPTQAEADLVPAAAGAATTGIDFTLPRAGAVSGVVTDAGGRELQNVCVQTFDADGSPGHETATSITGFYRLSSLHGGDNYVQFRDCGGRGLPSEWFDDKPDRASATPVTVGPDQEATADATLGVLTAPGAPGNVMAHPSDSSATVTWAAPTSDGGGPITGYTVTASPGGATVTTTERSATVGGLSNGTAYTFTVRATNGAGDGPESAPSDPVTPARVPDAPTGVVATRGNGSATVSWTAPASDGGSAITGYTVTASPGGATVTTTATSVDVTGLANGTSYTFTVRAANMLGSSGESPPSDPVTPATTPGAPTDVVATAGNAEATLSWKAPASDGGSAITGYTVTASPGGATSAGTGTSATVTGLTNGTTYTFTVRAVNDVGAGAESAPSNPVTPGAVPDAPTGVVATRSNASATVTWTAPASDGGSAVTGYTVTAWPGGATASAPGTSATVTGLTNGTSYTFTVQAVNATGSSAPSAPSNAVVPATTPDAPTDVAAIGGDSSATVSWTAPGDGGSPVIRYTVTASPGGATATTTGTSATVSGLSNGTTYTFGVHAVNDVGAGSESAPSSPVTPSTTPGAPTDVTALRGNGQAAVTWSAPASDGGSAIIGYTVTAWPGGATASTASTSATVTGLANGTAYSFTVVATNANGDGPASAPSNAVTTATTPDAPTAVHATAGPASATVTWTAPASDGGSPVTVYTVTASPGGATATSSTTSATVTGLTNGVPYTFTVRAANDVGDSAESMASNAVVPLDVPGAPTGVTAGRGNGEATVSWTAPSSDGGTAVTGYTVTASPGGATVASDTTSVVFGGLSNGTSYTFTVRATNGVGDGPESAPSNAVTPATIPGTPTDVRAEGIDGGATVTWTAPVSDGGSPVTLYTVTASPGGATATSSTTSATVTGLTNGVPYTFTVRAANDVGTGSESAPSNMAIPLPVPGPPLNVTASAGDGRALVTWAQPATGGPILSYTITASDGTTATVSGSQRSATLTGLANGRWYTFTVRATNAVGTGPASAPSNRVKPKHTGSPHRAF